MFGNLEIKQFSITILAKNNNPTILNPDFLKINNIVPGNWETSSPIFTTEELSQVTYKNNITIGVTPDRLILNQEIKADDYSFTIPKIASKYLDVLPHVNYHTLVINFLSYVSSNSSTEIDDYLREFILCPGNWKQFKNIFPKASFRLIYPLEDCQIELSIRPAYLVESPESENQDQPILVFSGDIERNFDELNDLTAKREKIKLSLNDCQQDLVNYQNLINQYLNRE